VDDVLPPQVMADNEKQCRSVYLLKSVKDSIIYFYK